jgi:hypothetical protein
LLSGATLPLLKASRRAAISRAENRDTKEERRR